MILSIDQVACEIDRSRPVRSRAIIEGQVSVSAMGAILRAAPNGTRRWWAPMVRRMQNHAPISDIMEQ
ncbi:hypothetical protein GCM10017602_32040 [Herbiconiux flava]|nr:hypothetical protein GCM10017602_32040 [Herbiconiux flava]